MKTANLFLENFFAWGVLQKIHLTGNREITLEEIDVFAKEVVKKANDKGIKIITNFSRHLTYRFIDEYSSFVSLKNGHCLKSLKLKEGISEQDCLEIFNMGSMPNELVNLLCDESIGRKVFEKTTSNEIVK